LFVLPPSCKSPFPNGIDFPNPQTRCLCSCCCSDMRLTAYGPNQRRQVFQFRTAETMRLYYSLASTSLHREDAHVC